MKRNDTSFAAEAEERQHEDGRRGCGAEAGHTEALELEAAGLSCHDHVRDHDHKEADMRDDEVHQTAAVALFGVIDDDQEVGRHRHDLEEHQEPERVVNGDDEVHGGHEQVHEETDVAKLALVLVEVGEAVDPCGERQDVDHEKDEAGKRVQQDREVRERQRRGEADKQRAAEDALEARGNGQGRSDDAGKAGDGLRGLVALLKDKSQKGADERDSCGNQQVIHA